MAGGDDYRSKAMHAPLLEVIVDGTDPTARAAAVLALAASAPSDLERESVRVAAGRLADRTLAEVFSRALAGEEARTRRAARTILRRRSRRRNENAP